MLALELGLVKRGLSLGCCALLATSLAFWATFLSSLLSLGIIQWFCVPPHRQEFPVPLSYLPRAARMHQPLIPSVANSTWQQCESPRGCVDDGVAEGWTDLHLNMSGLVDPGGRYRNWWVRQVLLMPLRSVGLLTPPRPDVGWLHNYGAEVYISYEYSTQGFCASVEHPVRGCLDFRGWLDSRSPTVVDLRNTFFNEAGEIVFDSSSSLFPRAVRSRLGDWIENIRAIGLSWFLPWLSTGEAWWVPATSRIYNAVLAQDLAKSPPIFSTRYVRIQVYPRLPIRLLKIVFQIEVSGLSRIIQAHPHLLSLGGAFTTATIVSGCFGCGATIVCIAVMIQYTKMMLSQKSAAHENNPNAATHIETTQ